MFQNHNHNHDMSIINTFWLIFLLILFDISYLKYLSLSERTTDSKSIFKMLKVVMFLNFVRSTNFSHNFFFYKNGNNIYLLLFLFPIQIINFTSSFLLFFLNQFCLYKSLNFNSYGIFFSLSIQ